MNITAIFISVVAVIISIYAINASNWEKKLRESDTNKAAQTPEKS